MCYSVLLEASLACAVEGVFFKNSMKNGKLISPVMISDIGCAAIIPSRPKLALIRSTGMRTAPERMTAINDAIAARRMLW